MTETLQDLLARWAQTAPDECRQISSGVYRLEAVTSLVNTTGSPHAASGVLGAVAYHATRRGLCLSYEAGPFDGAPEDEPGPSVSARVWPPEAHASDPYVSADVPARDGAATLRALATAALSSYLSSIAPEATDR